ncbi:MAG TPA: ADP-ribosylglycohydrolase family protein [Candidatus Hydrogenedentes bacterium]|nr:ADP-ribosylglycohydrolase family protein [Candidatus Hydrogenedentota bacterium]
MPYFRDLQPRLERVSYWADLRHEQGANATRIVRRLERELERAERELQEIAPPARTRRREPNDLDAMRALRPQGPRRLWPRLQRRGLRDRLAGAWLGRAAGCTLGAPVENWSIEAMDGLARRSGAAFPPEDYWPDHPRPEERHYEVSLTRDYLRGAIRHVPADDDLGYTLLGLLILERYGPGFTTEDVATAWKRLLPMACTAEDVALRNLKAGVPARDAGAKDNPYQEWIGADIRSDPWGYAAPAWPERAAAMAYRDAYLSHRGNGVYGAMFFAAAIAAAFAVDCPLEALRVGLTEIPRDCRLARDIQWALDIAPRLKDWRDGRRRVDRRFAGMHPVHTNNNACLTVFGLALGRRDFTRTIGLTVAMGLDNDCTAATAGSILGAIIGARNIPTHWWKSFRGRTRTYLKRREWFRNSDIVARFLRAAARTWAEPLA